LPEVFVVLFLSVIVGSVLQLLSVFFLFGFVTLLGLFVFLNGFRYFRGWKIAADTPVGPIRSIALGLVHIRGKAQSDQLITSPVSHTPCCFYRIGLEAGNGAGTLKSAHQSPVGMTGEGTRCFLVDDTGKVLIDLNSDNVAFRLERYAERLVDPAHPLGSVAGVTDEELLSYIERRARMTGMRLATDNGYLLTEFLVLPGQEYQMIGTCIENVYAKGPDDRNLICEGKDKSMPFVISSEPGDLAPKDFSRRFIVGTVIGGAFTVFGAGGILLFLAYFLNGDNW